MFYIQNNITFIVVKSLIEYIYSIKIAFCKNWKPIKRNIKKIHELIDNEIKEKYTFYFPFTISYYIKEFVKHKNCFEYNSLEDGASVYWLKEERKKVFINPFYS